MVAQDFEPLALEESGNLLHVLDGGGIDDPTSFAALQNAKELRLFLGVSADVLDLQLQVGPIDPGVEDAHFRPGELLLDVVDYLGGGGGGQRQNRGIAQFGHAGRKAR